MRVRKMPIAKRRGLVGILAVVNPLGHAGQGLSGLPDSILNLTSNPIDLIDPSQLPVDPTTCKPVYPYQPKGIWDGLSITKERDFTYPQSTGPDLYRRTMYTFWKRTVPPAS